MIPSAERSVNRLRRQVFEDEAFVFGREIGAHSHLANDGFGFARREVFRQGMAAAALRLKALLALLTFGRRRLRSRRRRFASLKLRGGVLGSYANGDQQQNNQEYAIKGWQIHLEPPGINGKRKR